MIHVRGGVEEKEEKVPFTKTCSMLNSSMSDVLRTDLNARNPDSGRSLTRDHTCDTCMSLSSTRAGSSLRTGSSAAGLMPAA